MQIKKVPAHGFYDVNGCAIDRSALITNYRPIFVASSAET